jgi:hypothetical protein
LLNTTLFNVNISVEPSNKPNDNALVLSGCRVTLLEETAYSEFDELNYYSLNSNDYGVDGINIELSFENIFNNPYFKFWARCITIRTDKQVLCKINYNSMVNTAMDHNFSKVTKEGKIAIGLGYYFRSQEEQNQILNCKSFCVEGFIALKEKKNVYGFMCRIDKVNDCWQMSEGNTYKIYKHVNISKLYH